MSEPSLHDTASVVVQSASSPPQFSINMVAPAPAAAAVVEEPASISVAHFPTQVGTAISKTVHYAETPVVSGYSTTLLKPELGALDTPFRFNMNRYFRPVKTIVPKLQQIVMEPKVNVEMPIVASLKEVEVHPPILPEVRIANPIIYPPVITSLVR